MVPARWVLEDPRRRPYFVFWTSEVGGLRYALKMAPSEAGDAVLITFENEETSRISILRRPFRKQLIGRRGALSPTGAFLVEQPTAVMASRRTHPGSGLPKGEQLVLTAISPNTPMARHASS